MDEELVGQIYIIHLSSLKHGADRLEFHSATFPVFLEETELSVLCNIMAAGLQFCSAVQSLEPVSVSFLLTAVWRGAHVNDTVGEKATWLSSSKNRGVGQPEHTASHGKAVPFISCGNTNTQLLRIVLQHFFYHHFL